MLSRRLADFLGICCPKFAKSREVAKDPEGRKFQVAILRKGPHNNHCIEWPFTMSFRIPAIS